MVNNFIMGGKLGDFLHSMYAAKQLSTLHNTKANIYLYDIGWELGIETAHRELSKLMLAQDYVNSVSILTDYEFDLIPNAPVKVFNQKLLKEGYIDLGDYIRSSWLYKTCWTSLYSKTFNFPISPVYQWIEYSSINNDLLNKVLIHRKFNTARLNSEFPFEMILEEYKDNLVFVSSSENDYNNFEYKKGIPFLKLTSLDNWFTSINSCSMFISNLSSPAVMAHALDKLRIIELPNTLDAMHCMGEEEFSENVYWYLNKYVNNLKQH